MCDGINLITKRFQVKNPHSTISGFLTTFKGNVLLFQNIILKLKFSVVVADDKVCLLHIHFVDVFFTDINTTPSRQNTKQIIFCFGLTIRKLIYLVKKYVKLCIQIKSNFVKGVLGNRTNLYHLLNMKKGKDFVELNKELFLQSQYLQCNTFIRERLFVPSHWGVPTAADDIDRY